VERKTLLREKACTTRTTRLSEHSSASTTASSSNFRSTCSGLMVKLASGGGERDAALLAVKGRIVDFSLDPLACPVACRALSVETSPKALGEEVLGHVLPMARDSCGHLVLESAIEHGTMELQHRITEELLVAVLRLSTHLVGHLVVRRALLCCSEPDQQAIVSALLSSQDAFSTLAMNLHGRQVIMTLMSVPAGVSRQAVSQLDCAAVAGSMPQGAKEVWLALREHCMDK